MWCVCMYGQLLVLVLQPCCSCSLSCAHAIGWNCILMSEINNNNNNNNFFVRCYGWGATDIDWTSAFLLERGQFGQKFQVQRSSATKNFSFRKTRINVLSYGIRMWAQFSFTLWQCMRLQTDGRTDGRTNRKTFAVRNTLRCITRLKTANLESTVGL